MCVRVIYACMCKVRICLFWVLAKLEQKGGIFLFLFNHGEIFSNLPYQLIATDVGSVASPHLMTEVGPSPDNESHVTRC